MIYTAHSWHRGRYLIAHVDGCAKIRLRDRAPPPDDAAAAWPCACVPIEPPTRAQLALCALEGIRPGRSRTATRLRLSRPPS